MTSAVLNIHLSEKWPKWLRTGSLRAVDRRIARPSSFPSFRVRGGVILAPPPWRRWLRPPPGRGLKRNGLSSKKCCHSLVSHYLQFSSCFHKLYKFCKDSDGFVKIRYFFTRMPVMFRRTSEKTRRTYAYPFHLFSFFYTPLPERQH